MKGAYSGFKSMNPVNINTYTSFPTPLWHNYCIGKYGSESTCGHCTSSNMYFKRSDFDTSRTISVLSSYDRV